MNDGFEPDFLDGGEDTESLLDSINLLYEQNREVLDTIHLLEEALPESEAPAGLHLTLFDLYSEIENMEEAGASLVEAARCIHAGKHDELAYFVYNQLELFAQLLPEAQDAYERLAHLISEDDGKLEANTLHLDQRKLYRADLIPELLLANHLHRSRVISDAEFLVCLDELCSFTQRPPVAPRALLYVLEDRELPHRDRAIEFLAHDAATPYLDLGLVKILPECLEILPPELCRRRAAIVFGQVAGEPLVGLLNPLNLQLKQDVSRLIEREPHFYLVSPAGYQRFLDQQRDALR